MAEAEYRAFKLGLVRDALSGRGINLQDVPMIDAHGEGRRRVALHARKTGDSVSAGFMAARSHQLIDIERCPVLVPALLPATEIARRIGAAAGDCDVWVTATDNGLDVAVKAERKQAEISLPKLTAIAVAHKLARLSLNGEPLVSHEQPVVTMGRAHVPLPPGSFLQATSAGEEALARLVLAGIKKAKHVADLFCGLGPFALRLAEQARVSAFDSDKAAIAALQAAVKATQGLKPVAASTRNLMKEPLVASELKEFDAVVLDPPRAGAEAQARKLAASQVRRVVSVSCDPESFARDAAILVAGGYKLEQVTAIDQFRYSRHVECVGVLKR
jgi:23S rRNA (uracil1939-C5)-methyltransferase